MSLENNGWNEWSRHVLSELERLSENYEKMNEKLGTIKSEIAMLKVKAGVWGGIAGVLFVVSTLIVLILKNKIVQI